MPACGEMCKALQELTDLAKELRLSRRKEDNAALDKMIQYFSNLNPFPNTKELRSISTGVTAEPGVNPECAAEVGTKILESMDGHTVADYKFSKKAQMKSLASVHYVEVEGEKLEFDSMVLFQRLVLAGMAVGSVIEHFFLI